MSTTPVTPAMIEQAEAHPTRSRAHDWQPGEQAEYDALRASGRSLYDDLRTQFDASHADALAAATERHGRRG